MLDPIFYVLNGYKKLFCNLLCAYEDTMYR